jgi:hypothetical protein
MFKPDSLALAMETGDVKEKTLDGMRKKKMMWCDTSILHHYFVS